MTVDRGEPPVERGNPAGGVGRIVAGRPFGADGRSRSEQTGTRLAFTRSALTAAQFVWRRSEQRGTTWDPIALRPHGSNQREPSARMTDLFQKAPLPANSRHGPRLASIPPAE